jgi:selenocysteine-specific elongation factor
MGFDVADPDVAGWLMAPEVAESLRHRLQSLVIEHAQRRPMAIGLPVPEAQQALGLPDARLVAELARGITPIERGHLIGRRSPSERPASVQALRRHLAAAPFRAPDAGQLSQLGLTKQELAAALHRGDLVELAEGVYLSPEAPALAVSRLARLPEPFTVSQVREVLGTTRRVAVPLLEYLDRCGMTRKVDSAHRVVTTS